MKSKPKKTPKSKKETSIPVRKERIQELADIIAFNRQYLSSLSTQEVEIRMKLNKIGEQKRGVNVALAAAYREMDKQVVGPVLNT